MLYTSQRILYIYVYTQKRDLLLIEDRRAKGSGGMGSKPSRGTHT